MRSFFPDHNVINAAMCCGNPDCDYKEAIAEAEPLVPLDIMCLDCCSVFYCNVDCQKTHSKNHKHQCDKDAQKLKEQKEWLKHNHNKENTDNNEDNNDELFRAISPRDDCPICFLPLPIENIGSVYYACCGNRMCDGCNVEDDRVTRERRLIPCCAFCREPTATSENEENIRLEKRMELNDSDAIYNVSQWYKFGKYGLPKDLQIAFDLCLRAAELGHSDACLHAAKFYKDGVIVAKDMTKASDYLKKAVMKGNIPARFNLGVDEWKKGNYRLASRHYLISAAAGHANSLINIAIFYKFQLVTKEEHSTALTSYSNVHKNEYSIERERTAAATQ